MKKITSAIAVLMLLTFTFSNVMAQTKGNGNVTRQERKVSSFDAINVGSAINLIIRQGTEQSVWVETDENLQDLITVKVSNGTLNLGCKGVKNFKKMDVYVTAVKLNKIEASGASMVTSETPLKSDVFSLKTSGAAKVKLDIKTDTFNGQTSGAASNKLILSAKTASTEISGAGNMMLKGSVEKHNTEVSGAAHLEASDLATDYTDAKVSGAGSADVVAHKQLQTDLSGAGSITYLDNGKTKKLDRSNDGGLITF